MEFPFRNELFTFSTGFSTGFVKKKRSFPSGFPLFPPGFQQANGANTIHAVIQPRVSWKVLGEFVDTLPFIKKKVGIFSLFFTKHFCQGVSFSPIWNEAPASFQHVEAAVFILLKMRGKPQFSTTFVYSKVRKRRHSPKADEDLKKKKHL